MQTERDNYKKEMRQELDNILAYWVQHSIDVEYGGFAGKIDNDNNIDAKAAKGSVLNCRILWSFSAAYNLTQKVQYLQMAERAYKYLTLYFIDKKYGGVYWTVDYEGKPLDTKKQVYALSFAVYGLSEYYKGYKEEGVKKLAIELYETIVKYSHDNVYGGYIEALTREWAEISDLRLSDKDANEKKSMNTHLHLLEGFANLYRIWPDEGLKQRIVELITIFSEHIVDKQTKHLRLFFDEQWNCRSNIISYGHDIEAAWLVQEAAEIITSNVLTEKFEALSINLANAAREGLDTDGGLWYEYDADNGHLVKEKHWWPQAEAMIGYLNAWQITKNDDYLKQSLQSWAFVKKFLLNQKKGEWYWGVNNDYSPMAGEDKVGLWKCPYHNSRACMEIIKRLS